MSSNTINNKIAQAIDTLIEKRMENKLYDITEIGKIVSIVDSEKGVYKVRLRAGIYLAYNIIQGTKYKINDEVYIKIPQGNFELKLLIEGIATLNIEVEDETEEMVEMSPKFIYTPVQKDVMEFGLVAGLNSEIILWDLEGNKQISTSMDNDIEDFKREFIKLQNDQSAKYLQISADFKTTLINEHNKGNYGLYLQFRQKDVIIYKKLDITNFIGQIYDYEINFFTQSMLINIEDLKYIDNEGKEVYCYLDKIIFFENDFDVDIDINALIPEENWQDPNIFIKNIKATFLKGKTKIEEGEEYAVELIAENGYVVDKEAKIELKLYDKNNKEVTEEEKYYIYWFKRMYPAYYNKKGYTYYDYNAYDGITFIAGEDKYNWIQINNYDTNAINEEGQNIYTLYQEELKQINRNYKDEELAIKQKELATKYGYKKNLLYLQTNLDNQLEYKVVVYKEKYDRDKNNAPIIEKTFTLERKSDFIDPKYIEISTEINNVEVEIETTNTDEEGNKIKEKYIKAIDFIFKLPEHYYGNWEFNFKYYNSNNEVIQEETVNGYSTYGPKGLAEKNIYTHTFNLNTQIKNEDANGYYIGYDYKCFISYPSNNIPGAISTINNVLIESTRFMKPLGFNTKKDLKYYLVNLEEFSQATSTEEEVQASLFSLRPTAPENFIPDSTIILKEDTGEYLTLKNYIYSLLLDKNI